MTDETPDDSLAVPDETPETPADEGATTPAADPANLELRDELDSIRATGEDLRG